MTTQASPRFKFHPMSWIFVMFSVVFIANIFLVYFANTSWNGLLVENAYEEGINYNQTLAKREAEKALGWQVTTNLSGNTFSITLKDKTNQPLTNAKVIATFMRPTLAGHDVTAELIHQSNGTYSATPSLPMLGLWDVKIEIAQNQQSLLAHHRINLQ